MMVFRRTRRPSYSFVAKTQHGRRQLSSGTTSKALASRIESMWSSLAVEHRAWDLLDPVTAGSRSVGQLYDLWTESKHDVMQMRQRAGDVDLEPLVSQFLVAYRSRGVLPDTADHVETHIRWLIPADTPRLRSTVTTGWLTERLSQYPGRASTRRKVHSDWSVFFAYCARTRGLFPTNPIEDVERPVAKRPPIAFYELADVKRIIGAAASREMCALWALMYGTGIEVSVALTIRRQDFDEARKEVRARGTKAHSRDRICRVADWAWPTVREYLRDKLPAVPLWPEWNRWRPTAEHDAVVHTLGLEHIALYHARHHWAVRACRAGTPIAIVAAQLGHASSQLTLTTYGRFIPGASDRDVWERRAAATDLRIAGTG